MEEFPLDRDASVLVKGWDRVGREGRDHSGGQEEVGYPHYLQARKPVAQLSLSCTGVLDSPSPTTSRKIRP